MPRITDKLVEWVDEIRTELGAQDRRITRIETTMRVIWLLATLLIMAAGVIVALLAHLKDVAT